MEYKATQYSDSTWSAKIRYKTASLWGYGMTEEEAIEAVKEELEARFGADALKEVGDDTEICSLQ